MKSKALKIPTICLPLKTARCRKPERFIRRAAYSSGTPGEMVTNGAVATPRTSTMVGSKLSAIASTTSFEVMIP